MALRTDMQVGNSVQPATGAVDTRPFVTLFSINQRTFIKSFYLRLVKSYYLEITRVKIVINDKVIDVNEAARSWDVLANALGIKDVVAGGTSGFIKVLESSVANGGTGVRLGLLFENLLVDKLEVSIQNKHSSTNSSETITTDYTIHSLLEV